MTFTAASIFRLVTPVAALPEDLRLGAIEWSLLLATSGRHTVAQLGAAFGLLPDLRDAAFARLVARGLIVERELSHREFAVARATVDPDEPRTLAAFLASDLDFVPLAGPTLEEEALATAPAPAIRRLSLRNLIASLTAGAASREDGELNVYRTFLRVDPRKLERHGIRTLLFEDDRLVDDPELQGEILAAAEATLGRPCPADVFV